jgi:hypothetical protein
MMTLPEARALVADTLGGDAVKVFDQHWNDMIYCVRSWALTDAVIGIDLVTERLEKVSKGIVAEAIKTYLSDNFMSADGVLELNVGETIYDKNLNAIPAIEQIKKHQLKIVSCMVSQCVEEFEYGRMLAIQIVERSKRYAEFNDTHGQLPRDYISNPPAEAFEAEVMRIEHRLPKISKSEGTRLIELYRMLRENRCGGI